MVITETERHFDHGHLPAPEEKEISGISTGLYLPNPQNPLTNAEMASWKIETASGKLLIEEDLMHKTWIKRRYRAGETETTFSMAFNAADRALNGQRNNIDLVIVSTSHPTGEDIPLRLREKLGMPLGDNLIIHAACSGVVLAFDYLRRNPNYRGKNILLVASEEYSKYVQDLKEKDGAKKDPALSQAIFSDGAAAIAFKFGEGGLDILYSLTYDFPEADRNCIKMAYDRNLLRGNYIEVSAPISKSGKLEQNGLEVYKLMRNHIPELIKRTIDSAGLSPSNIAGIFIHQATGHMNEGIALELPTLLYPPSPYEESFRIKYAHAAAEYVKQYGCLPQYPPIYNDIESGNFSSGSTLKAILRAIQEGKIKKGDIILDVGFGSGPFAAAAIMRFG